MSYIGSLNSMAFIIIVVIPFDYKTPLKIYIQPPLSFGQAVIKKDVHETEDTLTTQYIL